MDRGFGGDDAHPPNHKGSPGAAHGLHQCLCQHGAQWEAGAGRRAGTVPESSPGIGGGRREGTKSPSIRPKTAKKFVISYRYHEMPLPAMALWNPDGEEVRRNGACIDFGNGFPVSVRVWPGDMRLLSGLLGGRFMEARQRSKRPRQWPRR